ncbi:BamA/TamA family outer membrane protein [Flavobacteriaceae bacterium]|nr:BamA/TamA family outer membrane protein [Flavobacteriaceae bacterium]
MVVYICSSCNAVKRVADSDHLLVENSFIVNGKSNTSEALSKLSFQNKNTTIFGFPLRLHIYNLARPNKDSIFEAWLSKRPKRKQRLINKFSKKQLNQIKKSSLGLNGWLKKTGEAPSILDSLRIKKTKLNLERYYFSKGWFDRKIDYTVDTLGNKRATLSYNIETGQPYNIRNISKEIKTPILDTLYEKVKTESAIIKEKQFDIVNFKEERNRLTSHFRNSGVYHFSQDYVSFENDTINTNHNVDVKINIPNRVIRTQDSTTREPFKIYRIKEVNIFTDASFKNRSNSTPKKTATFNNFNFYNYNTLKYRPKAITNSVLINQGDLYSDLDKTRTYSYLSQLNAFKYPNIEYVENVLDTTLTANIYLNPRKKYGLSFDVNVSQSNIQKIGFSFSTGLVIRNIFRGAETLEISALGAIGASKDGAKSEDQFFDINELGADIKLNIPRLFFAFNTEKIIPKYMSPTTQLSTGFTSQKNIGLDKRTLNGRLSYNWFPKKTTNNTLDLLNLQYVRNLNPGNYFNVYQNSFNRLETIAIDSYSTPTEYIISNPDGSSSLDISRADDFIETVSSDANFLVSNPSEYQTVRNIRERKNRLIQNNFILASNFTLTKDSRENNFDSDFSIFRLKLELAGNLLNGAADLLDLKKNENGEFEVNDVAFSQYAKTEIDYIKLWNMGRSNVLALRSFVGIALPIGNSKTIPFSKSFFAGGANDNRAWTAYNLGPGRSDNNNEFNEANLKIAFSLEHRYNLFGNLNGAFFVDAGNIWNVLDDVENPKATFDSFDSLKDIAVGAGIGLRYDFGFFILRLDTGFKAYNPTYSINNRWLKDFNFSNAVYNFGINYPF